MHTIRPSALSISVLLLCGACGGCKSNNSAKPGGSGPGGGPGPEGGPGTGPVTMGNNDAGVPVIGGCEVFPSNNIFNTPINTLPADPNSAAYMATIANDGQEATHFHLDTGTETNQQASDFYGYPYNTTDGSSIAWVPIIFGNPGWGLSCDCTTTKEGSISVGGCASGQQAVAPIPSGVVVEGGIYPATDANGDQANYGDHHINIVDSSNCNYWYFYHAAYPDFTHPSTWNFWGLSIWNLNSNAMRPDGMGGSDAAGLPMMPLVVKAGEAFSGQPIHHAFRFTIESNRIRSGPEGDATPGGSQSVANGSWIWPARISAQGGLSSTNQPPYGQLFRIKASYVIPTNFTSAAKAIVLAMQTYGIYLADGGTDWYVSGDPNASWGNDDTISQIGSINPLDVVEAVDISSITSRSGFDINSFAVP